ncbi:Gfo/Idh/MocA family oxidoreductase [Oceanispirochaeta sp.]|jgi:predicted dehydrogenase|uniref:Gfo/Idh/MocA family protein n=1 Tax=Oceanispirochaeta sp. TaxID=2035350 RepID=UPI00261B2A7F|nr:Gfo/Idh/MocA family oxidoreductase [Oceanispirochaeta sp.]MDA3958078.1 Gfo/Idh/MocA family oxidoreductase [Oceanispirochaeta sp.]
MKKLQGGIIGAGKDSFIGFVHMAGARLMGESEITAGVFSRDPQKSKVRGKELRLAPDRVYLDYKDMIRGELSRPEEDRIDFVIIASPNSSHFDMTMAFFEAGIHVFADKPMALSLEQALAIRKKSEDSKLLYALTHGYTGYAMTKQARFLVETGVLGEIHRVVVEYTQGWLAPLINDPDLFDTWHLNPKISGPSCTMMDVGIHALNLVQTITSLVPEEVCADLTGTIPGNPLDDQGSVLIHFKNKSRGLLHASQVSSGEGNALRIRVYGSKAGIAWDEEYPETLELMNNDGSSTIFKKGTPALCDEARRAARLPGGHPEGLICAFANIYNSGFRFIRREAVVPGRDFPDADQGVTGLAFIEAIVKNSKGREKWTVMESL